MDEVGAVPPSVQSNTDVLIFYNRVFDKPNRYPDNKGHGANMGPTWVLSAPDGPHVGPMNLAIRVLTALCHLCNQGFRT